MAPQRKSFRPLCPSPLGQQAGQPLDRRGQGGGDKEEACRGRDLSRVTKLAVRARPFNVSFLSRQMQYFRALGEPHNFQARDRTL